MVDIPTFLKHATVPELLEEIQKRGNGTMVITAHPENGIAYVSTDDINAVSQLGLLSWVDNYINKILSQTNKTGEEIDDYQSMGDDLI